MDDFSLSSCSFLTETDDIAPEQQFSQADMQNVTLQNERLQEVNKQLQTSLDSIRSQLREALEAASSNGLTEQIQTLKIQLSESNEKREKLSQELKQASEDSDSNNSKLLREITSITSERDSISEELRRSNEKICKLKNERQTLRYALEEKQSALESAVDDMMKLKQQRNKQKQAVSSAVLRDLEEKNNELHSQCEKANNEKTMLQQEVDELKLKLINLEQSNSELKNKYETCKVEHDSSEEAVVALEKQLESQREEMDNMTKEKQKIIVLLQKMSAALSASEIKIESLQRENSSLSVKRTQKQGQKLSIISKTDILDLKIPFEGEIGDDCEKIIKLPQYQPLQRIQLIFNETAKRITEMETEMRDMKNSTQEMSAELAESKEEAAKYQQILIALLKDLKEISMSEQNIIKVSNCDCDRQFINYMADRCAELEPMLREKILSDPHFVSDDFFFTDDLTKRKMEVQSICDLNNSAFAILTAQFLVNTLLKKQVANLLGTKEANQQPKFIEREISVQDEIHDQQQQQHDQSYQEMQEKLQKTTKIAKQLKMQLKKSQQVQMELQKADSEQKTKIAQLQIQNDDLKNEVDVMNMKLQVAPKESNEQSALSQIKESFEEQKKESEANSMQLELRRKSEECNQLNNLLAKAQESFDSAIQTKTKQYRKQEDAMKREIVSLSEQVDVLSQQLSLKKKQQKKKERLTAQHTEQAINEITRNFEETKASLNATIDTLKNKAQQAHDMSQKLMLQISECEQKNQQLISENTQCNAKQRKIQMELSSMRQQINKERQHLQGQLSAQMMAYEAKIQKTEKEACEKADKRVNELLDIAHEALGDVYSLDDSDFNEDVFKQLVAIVKSDLDKLHYFQMETTKFSFDNKEE